MKTCPVEVKSFYADRQADRRDQVNSRFSQFCEKRLTTLVNTQNVSLTKIVDSSSVQRAETKYGIRIQFLTLVVMLHEVWLNA